MGAKLGKLCNTVQKGNAPLQPDTEKFEETIDEFTARVLLQKYLSRHCTPQSVFSDFDVTNKGYLSQNDINALIFALKQFIHKTDHPASNKYPTRNKCEKFIQWFRESNQITQYCIQRLPNPEWICESPQFALLLEHIRETVDSRPVILGNDVAIAHSPIQEQEQQQQQQAEREKENKKKKELSSCPDHGQASIQACRDDSILCGMCGQRASLLGGDTDQINGMCCTQCAYRVCSECLHNGKPFLQPAVETGDLLVIEVAGPRFEECSKEETPQQIINEEYGPAMLADTDKKEEQTKNGTNNVDWDALLDDYDE